MTYEPQARNTVLVVEDDDGIRRMLDAALRRHGFEVVVAATGDEAVAVYCEHRDAIAAVLLDVRMPHQDGPTTLAALRGIDAGVRAGFMSGDTGVYTTDDLLNAGAGFVIAKPFDVAEVADALRRHASTG
jgi:DNA-binding response OmpR family regulator